MRYINFRIVYRNQCKQEKRMNYEIFIIRLSSAVQYFGTMCDLRLCKVISFVLLVHFKFLSAQDVQVFPSTNTVNLDQFQLLVINLNQPTSISLNCSVQEALNQDSFLNVDLCLNGAAPNSTDWSIQTPFITIPPSTSFAKLDITLNTSPANRLIQTLVVWCCNGVNLNASARIDVDVQPNIVVNANYSVPATATLFPNPAYQNIAPCQCDLTLGHCDTNCCCDGECAPEELSTFQCISGMFGGDFATDDPQLCTTQQFDVPDYRQFTCIQRLNSPDLGLYFANVTGRQRMLTADEASSFLATASANSFTFPSDSNAVQQPTQTTPYRNGDPIIIETLLNFTGYLTLPQASLSGQCLRNALVSFQNDSFAYCDVMVTTSNCVGGSVLDINYYVTNTTLIKSTPGGGNANVNVTYRKDTSSSNYVKTNSGAATSSGVSLFNSSSSASTIITTTDVVSPSVSGGATCNNTVVSVTYVVTWEGNQVTNVDVDVILADVPLTGPISSDGTPPNNLLSQAFTVRSAFIIPPTVQRSGNPGYEVGLPVISGTQTGPTAIDTTQGFKIWQPGPSGLCSESSTTAPSFGQDTTTGCLLRLSTAEFADCATLRTLVEENQMALIPSAFLVARFGNSNTTAFDSADWTSVNVSLTAADMTNNTIPSQCDNIPSQVHIELVTSLSGRIQGFPITEIVDARVSWVRETWKLQCAGGGACTDGAATENFAVYSIVTFSSVPVTGITTTNECDGDATCWPELLLPLKARFYSSQPTLLAQSDFEYNLGWSLVVIFFALGAALLSLNWGKVGEAVTSAFPI